MNTAQTQEMLRKAHGADPNDGATNTDSFLVVADAFDSRHGCRPGAARHHVPRKRYDAISFPRPPDQEPDALLTRSAKCCRSTATCAPVAGRAGRARGGSNSRRL